MQRNFEINTTNNRLLNFLPQESRDLLAPHMRREQTTPRQVLEEPDTPITKVYFPEDGVISVVGTSPTMGDMEIGMIGKEGMTGAVVVLGNGQSPLKSFAQVAGSAMVIEAHHLRKAMDAKPSMRDLFLTYVQVFFIQTSQTALANAAALLPQRLARWLLMCSDRLTSKKIPITHEFLSVMLGVQRPGVTIVINELEERGLIQTQRGLISIVDRKSLIKLSNGTYGVPEAQYERLLGAKQQA
jgi:CRP-like cAMP-binding protein